MAQLKKKKQSRKCCDCCEHIFGFCSNLHRVFRVQSVLKKAGTSLLHAAALLHTGLSPIHFEYNQQLHFLFSVLLPESITQSIAYQTHMFERSSGQQQWGRSLRRGSVGGIWVIWCFRLLFGVQATV